MENKLYTAPEMITEQNELASFLSSSGEKWTKNY